MTTERQEPPLIGGEREVLDGFLEHYRATLLVKCEGLDAAQLRERSAPPSSLSLLGLVRHMAEVERWWFRTVLEGQDLPDIYCTPEERDGDFDLVDDADADADRATLLEEVRLAREAAARHDLDDVVTHPRRGPVSLRWILVHMIEEYARHCGHADLLRERIDGVTGE